MLYNNYLRGIGGKETEKYRSMGEKSYPALAAVSYLWGTYCN